MIKIEGHNKKEDGCPYCQSLNVVQSSQPYNNECWCMAVACSKGPWLVDDVNEGVPYGGGQ